MPDRNISLSKSVTKEFFGTSVTAPHHRHDSPAGEEVDELGEERALGVLLVVCPGKLLGGHEDLDAHKLVALVTPCMHTGKNQIRVV